MEPPAPPSPSPPANLNSSTGGAGGLRRRRTNRASEASALAKSFSSASIRGQFFFGRQKPTVLDPRRRRQSVAPTGNGRRHPGASRSLSRWSPQRPSPSPPANLNSFSSAFIRVHQRPILFSGRQKPTVLDPTVAANPSRLQVTVAGMPMTVYSIGSGHVQFVLTQSF